MQYELTKCLDQMDMKNERNSIIPQSILTDINNVFVELAKDYYASCKEDLINNLNEGGEDNLVRVAADATILLWLRRNLLLDIEKNEKISAINTILDNYEDVIKADSDSNAIIHVYTYDDKAINKAIKKSGLKDITISCSPIQNWDKKTEERKEADGRFIYSIRGIDESEGNSKVVLEYNMLKKHLINFLSNYQRIKSDTNGCYKIGFREIGSDTTESTSDSSVSTTDIKRH